MVGKKKYNFVRFLDLKWEDINCDLHLHTSRTDGKATIKEIIQYAIERGLRRIAFTEHVRRDSKWFHEFVAEVRKEQECYQQIEVLIGCEAKVIDRQGSLDVTEEITNECDIILGSVHRFPNAMGAYVDFSTLTPEQMEQIEYELTLELLEVSSIDVLAHPGSMYFRQYSTDISSKIMRSILKKSLKRQIAVEINTSYLSNLPAFLRLCAEINPYVSIGSDMHSLEQLGECRDRLRAYGIGVK
jgi:putative hydrolase